MAQAAIHTSKCNAGSLTKGDQVINRIGSILEVASHPRYRAGQLVDIRWRITGVSLLSRISRAGQIFQDTWPRNYPLNRIVGARSGGQI